MPQPPLPAKTTDVSLYNKNDSHLILKQILINFCNLLTAMHRVCYGTSFMAAPRDLRLTSLFDPLDPHMTQWGKMKIPNPYCTTSTVSASHVPSYPRISIVLKNVDAF